MDDEPVPNPDPERKSGSPVLVATSMLALLLSLAALGGTFVLQHRLRTAELRVEAMGTPASGVDRKIAASEERTRLATESLGQQLGLTKEEMQLHADAILRRQVTETARLETIEKRAEKRLGAVSTGVSAVKSEVGGVRKEMGGVRREIGGVRRDVSGVRTDVASARADLASTRAQLQRSMGDAGVMSGLIARNRDELATLRRRGDRAYYEFTLRKGDKPVMLARVKLSLKKLNEKHARYTMLVNVDEREIEKKDKTLDEPVQFYTGKNAVLYEIVVNDIQKNVISGYLSTPKGM